MSYKVRFSCFDILLAANDAVIEMVACTVAVADTKGTVSRYRKFGKINVYLLDRFK